MNTRAFIASLVSSVVWPTFVLVVLVLFRHEVVKLLERPLSRLKVGPVEADWEKTESVVKENLSVGQTHPVALSTGAELTPAVEEVSRKTGRSLEGPQTLVEERWQVVEEALRSIVADRVEIPVDKLVEDDFPTLLNRALRSGLLNAQTVRSIDGLSHMRNLAMTGDHLDSRRAQEFAVMADAVIYAMRSQPESSPVKRGTL